MLKCVLLCVLSQIIFAVILEVHFPLTKTTVFEQNESTKEYDPNNYIPLTSLIKTSTKQMKTKPEMERCLKPILLDDYDTFAPNGLWAVSMSCPLVAHEAFSFIVYLLLAIIDLIQNLYESLIPLCYLISVIVRIYEVQVSSTSYCVYKCTFTVISQTC